MSELSLYNEQQRQAVVARAIEAVQARIVGHNTVTLGDGNAAQIFDLVIGGCCERFVRQVFETALGLPPFSWWDDSQTAHDGLTKLAARGYEIAADANNLQAGDILGFAGDPGHILIYLHTAFDASKNLCAENTSGVRGYPSAPGTKVTALADVLAAHGGEFRAFRLFG